MGTRGDTGGHGRTRGDMGTPRTGGARGPAQEPHGTPSTHGNAAGFPGCKRSLVPGARSTTPGHGSRPDQRHPRQKGRRRANVFLGLRSLKGGRRLPVSPQHHLGTQSASYELPRASTLHPHAQQAQGRPPVPTTASFERSTDPFHRRADPGSHPGRQGTREGQTPSCPGAPCCWEVNSSKPQQTTHFAKQAVKRPIKPN